MKSLSNIANELNIVNLNPFNIDKFKIELLKLYESFGYNNVNITHTSNIDDESNTADLYFEIDEGKITKINKINFIGNKLILLIN